MKRHIKIHRKEPVILTKKTKLKPDQLERVNGAAGNGLATRYDANGHQSLELTRRLAKARNKAKRYVLFSDQLGRRVYVADREKADLFPEDSPLTFNRKEALTFFHGFDDPERKKKHYNEYKPFIWNVVNA